jgi:hypothetical protein
MEKMVHHQDINGHTFSIEEKEKISEMSKKMWANETFREKMSQKRKDIMDDDLREKCGRSHRGKKRPDHSAKLKGKKKPELSIKMSNLIRNETWKENISSALKREKQVERAHRAAIKTKKKSI